MLIRWLNITYWPERNAITKLVVHVVFLVFIQLHAFCLSWQRIQSKQFSNIVGTKSKRKNACFSKFIIFCPNQVWHKNIPFWGNRPSCLVYHEHILELVLCKCPFTRYDYSYTIVILTYENDCGRHYSCSSVYGENLDCQIFTRDLFEYMRQYIVVSCGWALKSHLLSVILWVFSCSVHMHWAHLDKRISLLD